MYFASRQHRAAHKAGAGNAPTLSWFEPGLKWLSSHSYHSHNNSCASETFIEACALSVCLPLLYCDPSLALALALSLSLASRVRVFEKKKTCVRILACNWGFGPG